MFDGACPAYLFHYQSDDLYAVSHDITGLNITRSACKQVWIFCEQFELGLRAHAPAPVMAEAILNSIAGHGYYVWRGCSGSSNRPPK
jgi:hypothetical protein